eukprot:GHUV01048490.1.p1 GENE.GHUV01048490.1~~GHUV01048490.1.p1  ORF type:complete len:119 (-),score=24.89 GHUV01048490.1:193-549(-)
MHKHHVTHRSIGVAAAALGGMPLIKAMLTTVPGWYYSAGRNLSWSFNASGAVVSLYVDTPVVKLGSMRVGYGLNKLTSSCISSVRTAALAAALLAISAVALAVFAAAHTEYSLSRLGS